MLQRQQPGAINCVNLSASCGIILMTIVLAIHWHSCSMTVGCARMTTFRVNFWGRPLFFNMGCEKYCAAFAAYLLANGWKVEVFQSCPIYTIDESGECLKTEMLARFWDWYRDHEYIYESIEGF